MSKAARVLIIEDSLDDQDLYRRALTKGAEGAYDIVAAQSGEDGIARMAERRPDCVLLDYSLPGRNGVEVLKRMRAQDQFIPVVMLTGQGNEAVAVAAMQEGAQNYIVKSTITPESIQRVVRVAIEYCAMQRRLHEQRISLEIFTRALAHDLKEPVRTISSFLSLMTRQESLSETGATYFEHIRSAAERMALLIDTVYLYTRLDGSAQEASRESCDAGAVLDDVRANIAELVKERGATIANEALPTVTANRMQLLQVLQNLICNAIHHGPEAPAINVSANEQGDRFVFHVADNGPGVPDAQREKIFEPFRRMSQGRERGLGMGLAICKRVVESHGGKIWCEPAHGGGATFVFTLPKQKDQPAAAAQARKGTSEHAPMADSGDPLANVLLVDDSEADVELTRIMLLKEARLKCNLLVARDAEQALTIMNSPEHKARDPIDLMLLDINMPGLDGLELLKQLRADGAHAELPIIMCTTSSYDQDMERAAKLGATGYVTKPAELAKIKSTLENIAQLRLRPEDKGYALTRAH